MVNTTAQYSFGARALSASKLALIRLHHEPQITVRQARALFEAFDCPSHILSASVQELTNWLPAHVAQVLLRAPSDDVQQAIKRSIDWASEANSYVLTWLDGQYPAVLRQMPEAPVVFYARGCLTALTKPMITLVGARTASARGLAIAKELAHQVAAAGWCVVSGLARGIDAAAHLGALSTGCASSTLAVMGTGPDQIYPLTNRHLARKILGCAGLLLTEFAPGTPPMPKNFPRRNQWVAALGRATVVVQAKAHSGSLITARLANEYGREVFAVPGCPKDPLSQGPNHLLKQGACLLETVSDIWQVFGLTDGLG
jgi:DNA processing protein